MKGRNSGGAGEAIIAILIVTAIVVALLGSWLSTLGMHSNYLG
ncbi:hypothetical protein [Pseudomonas matsuisoli]|nr:hypothetical protein [Pseudomonas matsuisoli]